MTSLSSSEFEELVSSWIGEHKGYRDRENVSIGTAYRKLNAICDTDAETALALIAAIVNKDSSDEIMEVLAAGPLENVLVRHGKEIVDAVVSLAVRDKLFRDLLGGVWVDGLDPEISRRIEAGPVRHLVSSLPSLREGIGGYLKAGRRFGKGAVLNR